MKMIIPILEKYFFVIHVLTNIVFFKRFKKYMKQP